MSRKKRSRSEKPPLHVVSFSGGKDSTAMLLLMIEQSMPIDKAHVYFSNGRLSMTAASGNYSTQVQIDGESTIGFGFELDYMIDALRQFRGEPQVKMKLNSPVAPIVLEAEGRGDFAMVLPVRMKEAAAA